MGRWVMKAGFSFKAMRPGLPTTGFFALLTFAPMCESIDVYGFGRGERTADRHRMNLFNVHHLDAEHRLLDRIVSGQWKRGDFVTSDESDVARISNLLATMHLRVSRITV